MKMIRKCVGNIWSHATHFVRKGDVDEAFAKCDRIIERTYTTGQQEHVYLETEAAVRCSGEGMAV